MGVVILKIRFRFMRRAFWTSFWGRYLKRSSHSEASRQPERIRQCYRGYAMETTKVALATSQKRARGIMGNQNFHGISEVMRFNRLMVSPTRQQLAELEEIPFLESTLEEAKDTHVLVADFQTSIHDIRLRTNEKLFRDLGWWCSHKNFVTKKSDRARWQLIRKTGVAGSASKGAQEQIILLGENRQVPTARATVYASVVHCLATGEKMFPSAYVRTSIVGFESYYICVGFGKERLRIDPWRGNPCRIVELAEAVKPETSES